MNIINRSEHSSAETYAIVFVCMLWGSRMMSLITSASLRIMGQSDIAYFVVPFIELFVMVLGWKYIKNKYRLSDLFFFLACLFSFLSSYYLFPENKQYLDEYFTSFLVASSMLFIGLLFDMNKMEKPLYFVSVLTILFQIYYSLVYQQNTVGSFEDVGEEDYSGMYYAYVMLPHVLFTLYYMMKNFNILRLIISIVGVFLLVSYGSRGPVLCVFSFVALYIVFVMRIKRKWIVYLVLSLMAVSLYLYLDVILGAMQYVIGSLGMRTKIVDMMLEGVITDDSGRHDLITILRPHIENGPFFGHGYCGSWPIIGIYPHNLFYDFLITFGQIPGVLLFILLVVYIVSGFRSCGSTSERGIWLLFFVAGFIHLFFSDSFINTSSFFMLIGYSAAMKRKKRVSVLAIT